MSGWFAVSREILDHPIFKGRPDRLYAWIWILSNAAYKDTQQDVGGAIIDVPRGCLCASQAMMQSGTGMSRQSLRTFINLLENANVVSPTSATKATKSRTMLKVCNYDKYQNEPKAADTDAIQDRYRTDTNEHKDVIPEVKREKRVSNETLVHFDAFWAVWPVKNAKAAAVKAWAKLSQPDRLAAIENAKSFFERWRSGYPTANPIHPASYLNGRRWEDELDFKFKASNGVINGQADNHQSYADRPNHGSDATMSNILRIAGNWASRLDDSS